ncbi:hypothetical protein MKW92_035097 [Papaver armeniacum]|nr:hypothetical protein MKW92_035097 [Papaver armeniacum]
MKIFQSKQIFLFLTYFVTVLVLSSRPTSSWLEVEYQQEFSYAPGTPNGPEMWGDLHPEWATCKIGARQSPIDLANEKILYAPTLGELKLSHTPAFATLKNRGHDISLQWNVAGSAGSIQINGTTYVLDQVHWHSPSEHTINGRRFDMELHMVHVNVQLQKVAVVGVVYMISDIEDPFLARLESSIFEIYGFGGPNEVNVGVVDPNKIDMSDTRYYRYMGSLTTPPCTEGVIWTVKERVMPVRRNQLMLLRRATGYGTFNARPLQPINNRDILYYSPGLKYGITLPTFPSVDTM